MSESNGMDQAKRRIVARIIANLKDRRGLKQAWLDIDDVTKDEIIAEWQQIVLDEIGPLLFDAEVSR